MGHRMQQAGVGFNSIRQGAGETLLAGREAEGTGGALSEGGNTKRNPNRSPLLLVVMFRVCALEVHGCEVESTTIPFNCNGWGLERERQH